MGIPQFYYTDALSLTPEQVMSDDKEFHLAALVQQAIKDGRQAAARNYHIQDGEVYIEWMNTTPVLSQGTTIGVVITMLIGWRV